MKKPLFVLACVSILLAGCAAFKTPSASQTKRNELQARSAEGRRAEHEREQAINARAADYERQGMSRENARAAAHADAPGALTSR